MSALNDLHSTHVQVIVHELANSKVGLKMSNTLQEYTHIQRERERFPFHIHSSVSLLMDPQIIILTPGSYCFTSLSVWLQSSHLHKYIRSVSCVHLACVVWNAIWLSVLMCNSVRPPVHSVLDQLYILFT